MRTHLYGVIFWNESTDEEVATYFESTDFFSAEKIADTYHKDGFIKGAVHFIEENNLSFYKTKIESFAMKKTA